MTFLILDLECVKKTTAMIKTYNEFINEEYKQTRNNWNWSALGLYLFYMVKYKNKDGKELWYYSMTKQLKYEPEVSAYLGYKTEDDFRKFAYFCFMKQKKDIINDFEKDGYTDVDVICSPKYVLSPQRDSANIKPWMSNVFNDCNKMYNANTTLKLTGDYERYENKFDKRYEEIRQQREAEYKKQQEIERQKRADEEAEIQRQRAEFMKKHAGDSYYQYYGWPWEWTYVHGCHYVGD